MWKVMPKPGFVADPRYGSVHNRAAAVDVSLYELKTGKIVEMPSKYDEFSERAGHGYSKCTPTERMNREMLKKAMLEGGFSLIQSEWWHYEAQNHKKYDILDIPFSAIEFPRRNMAEEPATPTARQ
jgi:D-alanyl-D-alanine dipeptidase